MRLLNDEAWVLETRELGEADLIVALFCREHGSVRGVARAARKSRRRFGGSLAPLTRVRLTWGEKAGRELHRIDGIECTRSFASMQREPVVQAAVAVVCEVAQALAREGQPGPREFDLIAAVAQALEAGCDPWIAVRYLEYWMLRLHGVLPDFDRCASCGRELGRRPVARVDLHGIVRCRECAGGRVGERVHLLRDVERALLGEFRSCAPLAVTGDARLAGPSGTLDVLLRGSLEAFVERRFRSYRHLRALASDRR
ncbi:MAG TPA: DNA repair protein RecO [Candidatus Polarisedimenticolaceae bacterium]|nr:DNA repair protein RecO [Candidatus Polarisedimenticolaceae bacterium]